MMLKYTLQRRNRVRQKKFCQKKNIKTLTGFSFKKIAQQLSTSSLSLSVASFQKRMDRLRESAAEITKEMHCLAMLRGREIEKNML